MSEMKVEAVNILEDWIMNIRTMKRRAADEKKGRMKQYPLAPRLYTPKDRVAATVQFLARCHGVE
jgi:hypothetical protein